MSGTHPKKPVLSDFKITHAFEVVWGEMDSFDHLNNIFFFRYFESIRIRYLEEVGLLAHYRKTGVGMILSETYCRYRIPLVYPDDIIVGARTTELKPDRLKHEYGIFRKEDEALAALGFATTVCYDHHQKEKTDWPAPIIQNIQKLDQVALEPIR